LVSVPAGRCGTAPGLSRQWGNQDNTEMRRVR
jgi:hypothetical protein